MTSLHHLLASNIRDSRKRLGFSQMKVAEDTGISEGYLSEIENARKFPAPHVLERLALTLGLRPYQLLFDGQEWEVFERYRSIMHFAEELKQVVSEDIDDVARKYSLQ